MGDERNKGTGAFGLLLGCALCESTMGLYSNLQVSAGTEVLTHLLTLAACAPLLWLYAKHPPQGPVPRALLCVLLLFSAGRTLCAGYGLYSAAQTDAPALWGFCLVFVVAALYGATLGLRSLCHVGGIALVLALAGLGLLVLSVAQWMRPQNLQYMTPAVNGATWFVLPPEVLLLPLLQTRQRSGGESVGLLAAALGLDAVLKGTTELVMGQWGAGQARAAHTVAQLGSLSVFRRMDGIQLCLWLLLCLLRVTAFWGVSMRWLGKHAETQPRRFVLCGLGLLAAVACWRAAWQTCAVAEQILLWGLLLWPLAGLAGQGARRAAALGLALCLCLAGCGQAADPTQNIVAAVYVERTQAGYEARLLCQNGMPNADTAQAEKETKLLQGEGANLQAAIQAAEESQNRAVFYGHAERLLLGPRAAREGLFPVLEYFAAQQLGRPNTAVWQLEKAPEAEDAEKLLQDVDALRGRGEYICTLYMTQKETGCALVPVLRTEKEDGPLLESSLTVYSEGLPVLEWSGAEQALAAVWMGQADALHLTLEQGEAKLDGCQMNYEGKEDRLDICLYARLKSLTAPDGTELAEDAAQKESAARQIEAVATGMAAQTFGEGRDALQLASWMRQWNAAWCDEAEKQGLLYDPARVRVRCELE